MSSKGVVRTGISLPKKLLDRLDELRHSLGIESRSKAIQEAINSFISERIWLLGKEEAIVAGSVTIFFTHGKGDIERKLVELQHHFLDLIRSTTHVHLTEDKCMEVILVVGSVKRLRDLVSYIESLKGVEHVRASFHSLTLSR